MTRYGFRKVFTSPGPQQYTVLPTTPNTVCVFDKNAYYDDFKYWIDDRGFFICGVKPGENLLQGDTYVAVSYEDEDDIDIYAANTVVSKMTILYASTSIDDTFKSYLHFDQFSEQSICEYASYTQDYDSVIDYIVTQNSMSYWVTYIRRSDADRFKPLITDQQNIYTWATAIGDDSFFDRITDQSLLFSYAVYFPDRHDWVKDKLTDPYWVELYNERWPDDQIILPTPTPDPTDTPEPTPEVTPTPSDQA